MNPPYSITFTGIDEKTDLARADALRRKYTIDGQPMIEWGILYSESRPGNRYPSVETINEIAGRLINGISLHVCGSKARTTILERKNPSIQPAIFYAQRLQWNGTFTVEEANRFCALTTKPTITQHKANNEELVDNVLRFNHQVLCDESGGRGIEPKKWPGLATYKAVGYAGGIGPDNIVAMIESVPKPPQRQWWIDIESSLRDRDSDWFNLDRVEETIIKALFAIRPDLQFNR